MVLKQILDQTIEELEAEVLKELEEANGSAPLKKGAAPAEPMKKIDADEGEIEDLGDEPEKAAAKSKISSKSRSSSGVLTFKKDFNFLTSSIGIFFPEFSIVFFK